MKRLIAMSVMAVALCACSTAKKVSADCIGRNFSIWQ